MVSVFDPAIRFSAILLLLLIACFSQRDLLPSRSRLFLQLACISVVGSLLDYTPGVLDLPLWVTIAAGCASAFDLPLLWLFVVSLFNLGFRTGWPHALIGSAYAVPKLLSHLTRCLDLPLSVSALALIANLFGLVILVHLVFRLLRDRRNDLLDGRRRSRLRFALIIVLFSAASTLSNYVVPFAWLPTVRAGLVAFATLYAFIHLIRLPEDVLLFSAVRSPRSVDQAVQDEGLARLIRTLERALQEDRPYLHAGLTVSSFASQLSTSEAELRRTIRDGLGHDNFSTFVNSYRIAAVKQALRDPEQSHLPILTVALDHGFNSLSPFNRAFKAQVGVTPSTYRKQGRMG